jgi:hypothetical protein
VRLSAIDPRAFIAPATVKSSHHEMADLEATLLRTLHERGEIADTGELAASLNVDHQTVVGLMKSLQSSEMILVKVSYCITYVMHNWAEWAVLLGWRINLSQLPPRAHIHRILITSGWFSRTIPRGISRRARQKYTFLPLCLQRASALQRSRCGTC